MLQSKRELWAAFAAMVVISLVYAFVVIVFREVPAASGLFGHLIGVFGFILMLMTEILYTLRKRSRMAHWGRMSSWLEFHIFTGLVGPFMVLIHSSWKFNGLAGVVMLLTVIIVVSGFIGRYIYTAVPRSADGIEIETAEIEAQIVSLENTVRAMSGASSGQDKQNKKALNQLIKRQKTLRRQMNSLATSRRLMALWHTIHIPIGMALFTSAFIHTGAAFYYATLLR